MSVARVLVAEDEAIARENIVHVLDRMGFETTQAANGRDAVRELDRAEYDLVITDLKMPGLDGMAVLEHARARWPNIEVLVVTGHGSVTTAVEAMQKGAFNFLEKPFNIKTLRALVQNAMEKRSLKAEVARLRMEIEQSGAPRIIGQSRAIRTLKDLIAQLAPVDCNVLILGETGTGKELVARTIHAASLRSRERFLAVNCASFNEELLTSELFGYEAGAFTGAKTRKPGLLETAHRGTFLLDEIGDMGLAMQAKLLRVLENKTLMRVGGTEDITVDVRILAATNKDLKDAAASGEFRPDLYYRLNVVSLHVPSLSERKEDIPLLCNYFLHTYATAMNKDVRDISPEVLELLGRYEFPGNVRELENIMERAVVMCNGNVIQPVHLPPEQAILGGHLVRPEALSNMEQEDQDTVLATLKENERRHIMRVLQATEGNRTNAAEILGIDRASLWRKLKRLEIE